MPLPYTKSYNNEFIKIDKDKKLYEKYIPIFVESCYNEYNNTNQTRQQLNDCLNYYKDFNIDIDIKIKKVNQQKNKS